MAANDDTARLLVSIEATQRRFEKQLASIAKSGADTADGIEKRFQRSNDNVARSFQTGGRQVERSLGAQRAAVSNLSFQLNDIAMGLASGTSPFTIMVQQGSQVSQALQGSGGIIGAVKTLGGALATMVNPVSLASFALIGLTGVAVQYITTLSSGVLDVDKYLKEHGEVIRSFEDAWGVAEKGAKQYTDAARQVELQKLRDEFGSTTEAAKALAGSLSDDILSGETAKILGGATKSASDFSRALTLLEQDIPDFRQFSVEMAKIEGMTGLPEPVRKLATELRLTAQESIPLQEHLEKVAGHLKVVRLTGEQAREAFAALTAQALGLGTDGGGAVTAVAGKIKTDLIPAMTTAIQQVAEFAKNYRSLQDQVNQTPLGQLSPVFSGGGQFLNPDQLQNFRAGEANMQAVGSSAAAAMIRGFETYVGKAYADTRTSTGKFDAWRAGFGSDTVTRANGDIEKVTKDTVVTLDEAERDLSRRIIEFQTGIQSAIGIDTWRSLSEGQQAALTSIAYNYGSLPKKIVAAIQSGGGPEVVAQAITGLSANPSRRKQEAQSYLSGSGLSLKDAGIGGKTPSDLFKGDVQQVQARIDALNAEYEAQAKLNPLVNDYGYAVEKARIEQQLLSEAQKAGLEITPQLREQISGLAENTAKAASANERLKESQRKVAEAAKEFNSLGKEALGGFISDLRNGVSAADALKNALNRVLDKLIDIGLNSLFSGIGGGGGLLGGAIIPGILHSGGVAGSDGYGHRRAVSPSTFAGAKRYHTGGVAGLQPGEVPAILQRGEVVLPRGTKAAGQQGIHVTVGVSADSNGNLLPFVESVSQGQVKKAAPSIVSAATQRVVPTMAAYQNDKAGAEWR
ncbi:phage tail length tape measure family protein [Shinella zoogloeoides]|uniref:phage tail length tape measure family protein n=1 Tax=Shinella zoogloeoides TaxID=352475 RepID=UPI001F56E22D|nr:phage tail length tape measure family protein [Shinella zoogloeoides]